MVIWKASRHDSIKKKNKPTHQPTKQINKQMNKKYQYGTMEQK